MCTAETVLCPSTSATYTVSMPYLEIGLTEIVDSEPCPCFTWTVWLWCPFPIHILQCSNRDRFLHPLPTPYLDCMETRSGDPHSLYPHLTWTVWRPDLELPTPSTHTLPGLYGDQIWSSPPPLPTSYLDCMETGSGAPHPLYSRHSHAVEVTEGRYTGIAGVVSFRGSRKK